MRKQVGENSWSIQGNGNCPLYICLPPPYPSAWRTGHHYSNSRVPLLSHAASTQQPAQVQPAGAIHSNKIIKTSFFENSESSQVYGLVLIYIYVIHHFPSFITHKLWGTTDHTEYILHITSSTLWYCLKITLIIKISKGTVAYCRHCSTYYVTFFSELLKNNSVLKTTSVSAHLISKILGRKQLSETAIFLSMLD